MSFQEKQKEARAAYQNNDEKAYELYKELYKEDPTNPEIWNGLGNCISDGIGVEPDLEQAIKYYKMAAEIGNVNAQFNYANVLEYKQDPECIKWFEKAYENGEIEAAYRIAMIYKYGEVVPKNDEMRNKWLQIAADQGYAMAQTDLGVFLINGEGIEKNEGDGIQWMQRAANTNNGLACRNMSILYRDGVGVKKDLDKASYWAIKLAKSEDGDIGLVYDYAVHFFAGDNGFPKDVNRAVELFTAAAEQGDTLSIENVGVLYSNPELGYATDVDIAIQWFEKGANQGSKKSFANLKELYGKKYSEEQAKQKYFEIAKKVADDGYCSGMLETAIAYFGGIGVVKDEEEGMKYLSSAVEGEYTDAMTFYGKVLNEGAFNQEKNPIEALEMFEKAAEKGDLEAAYYAGLLLFNGDGIEHNQDKSIEYLTKVADADNAQAMYDIARVKTNDSMVAAIWDEDALGWITKAAEHGYPKAISDLAFFGLSNDNGEEALKWLNIGISNNVYSCFKMMGDVLLTGLCGQQKDQRKAFEYYKDAADKGLIYSAMAEVAGCYYHGVGVEINYSEAFKYAQKGADGGNEDAKILLGYMFTEGKGTEKNTSESERLMREVISNSLNESAKYRARFHLAYILSKTGRTQEAISLYKEIANNEEDRGESWRNIALFYAKGEGVSEDINEAINYFEKALAAGCSQAQKDLDLCNEELQRRTINYNPTPQPKKQGCYVATAVYGSYDCPEVWTLRRYRDQILRMSISGRLFIRVYYLFSPFLVKIFGKQRLFKKICKGRLDGFVKKLNETGIESGPYKDL